MNAVRSQWRLTERSSDLESQGSILTFKRVRSHYMMGIEPKWEQWIG